MGAQPWGVITSRKNFFFFFLLNLSRMFTFLLYCIFIHTPLLVICQVYLLYELTTIIESVKCIFILHLLNVNNV